MKKQNLTIGQELTLNELGEKMGFEAGELSEEDIKTGNKTSIDNYDGNKGVNVDFELVEYEGLYVHEFVVRITDIQDI